MSKRALTAYLGELTKKQLQEQVLDLYTRFKPVKTYYNFVFNPKEEKLLDEAKFKIGKEYFSISGFSQPSLTSRLVPALSSSSTLGPLRVIKWPLIF